MRRYSSTKRALVLHFTRHPGDPFLRVALANHPAHDIILLPDGVTDSAMYHLVRDYTRALTKLELLTLLHTTKGGSDHRPPSTERNQHDQD